MQRAWLFWLLALGIAAGAFGYRMAEADAVALDGGMRITEFDTVRRLARLHELDRSQDYPVVEALDGAPAGSVSHWTLPMDWFIRGLDPLVRGFFPAARPYEAGACLAGPLLAALSVLLLAAGARALAGPGLGLLAALFYAASYSVVNVSWFGNGDHQNLQHAAVVAAVFAWLVGLERARPAWGLCSGLALGLATWISTESQLVLFILAATHGVLMLRRDPREDATLRRLGLAWVAGNLATLAVGFACENRSVAAFHWDQISWFQLMPVAVFGVFLLVTPHVPGGRLRAAVAGVVALAAVALPFAVSADLRATMAAELANFSEVNTWLQAQVSEYRSALLTPTGWSLLPLAERFSWAIFLLPLALVGVAAANGRTLACRSSIVALAGATFVLAIWEVKLAHLFAILWPLCLVLGARAGWALVPERVRPPAGVAEAGLTTVVAALALTSLPDRPSQVRSNDDAWLFESCAAVMPHLAEHRGTVLAPWGHGAHLMYYAGAPVVASGYHRNLAGILDHLRILASTPDEDGAMREMMRARGVRYLIVWHSRLWLEEAQNILWSDERFAVREADGRLRYTDLAERTLFWRLRQGQDVPGFLRIGKSPAMVGNNRESLVPAFQLFAVRP